MTIPIHPTSERGRSAITTWQLAKERFRPGLELTTISPDPRLGSLGPYASIGRFSLSERVFPPHPHAGFTAMTYVLRSSPGMMLNRDSLGDVSRIEQGGAHWTIANSGMLHEETPEDDHVPVEGFQIFINHPRLAKQLPPTRRHAGATDLEEWQPAPGVTCRLVMGAWDGRSADGFLPVRATLADITLDPEAVLTWQADPAEERLAFVEAGSAVIEDGFESVMVGPGGVISLPPRPNTLRLTAGTDGTTVFAFGGLPIAEPVVAGGPFIMSSKAELEAAFARFRSGQMGRLEPRTPSSGNPSR